MAIAAQLGHRSVGDKFVWQPQPCNERDLLAFITTLLVMLYHRTAETTLQTAVLDSDNSAIPGGYRIQQPGVERLDKSHIIVTHCSTFCLKTFHCFCGLVADVSDCQHRNLFTFDDATSLADSQLVHFAVPIQKKMMSGAVIRSSVG